MKVVAWLVLVQVKNKRERSLPVRPPSVEKTSRLRSRDPVANGVKSRTVSWLSLKTKVEPRLRGSRVMSGNCGRLHRVRGVSSGLWENHWVFCWSTKPRPKNRRRKCSSIGPVWLVGTSLAGEEHRSDRCATTQSGDFEVKDTRRDRKACIEAKQVCGRWASVRWSDDKDFRFHPRGACIPN
jgi:hypothetical protein